MRLRYDSLLASLGLTTIIHAQRQSTRNLTSCLSAANVPVSLPSSQNYNQLSQPYNLRLHYTPAVIVLPKTTLHISNAVSCASRFGTKVQARSGGHSYASFSLGGRSSSMVIDLSSFQEITVIGGVAHVGAGVRLGNLALGIYNQSSPKALPHGVCPGVGIGGHSSHGGYWYSSRTWGLTLDTIVGLDVVLANGSFIHASSSMYPEIFWALRGAADSIGIITKLSLQTQPAPSSIVNWVYDIPVSSAAVAASAFLHLQDFARNASVTDSKIGFGIDPKPSTLRISGTFRGSQDEFTSKIVPELLRGLPTPSSQSVKSLDWITSLTQLWGGPLQQPLSGYNAHDNFYAKSILVPESSPLTKAALTSYFNYIFTNGSHAPQPWFAELNLLGGPGSVINNPPPAAANAAYSGRGALWVVQHYSGVNSSPPKEVFDFVSGLNQALEGAMPGTTFGAYANYVDPELSAEEAHRAYFSADTYQRLVKIKKEVDPRNVFSNPQSVGM